MICDMVCLLLLNKGRHSSFAVVVYLQCTLTASCNQFGRTTMSDNQSGGRSRFNTEIDTAMRRMTSQSVLFSHAVAQVLGMHSTDLECLGFLVDEGRVTAGRLADLTGLTTGAATRMI